MTIAGVSAAEFSSPSEARLDVSAHGPRNAALEVVLPVGFDAVVGRTGPGTLQINDPGVSRQHARLVHDKRGVVLTDLGSTNGTYVNGERVTEPALLRDGATIGFGSVSAVFRRQRPLQHHEDGAGTSNAALGAAAGLGPLIPEAPIGESPPVPTSRQPAPGSPSRSPNQPLWPQGKRADEYRGTVLNVIQPIINVNPWLVLDIKSECGKTIAVRARFFWGSIRCPYVAEGHYVRVAGRMTGEGYLKPRYIINETTGSRWRRWL